ncbi:MAG: S41 family peptidase [Bacteroidota bacterium]
MLHSVKFIVGLAFFLVLTACSEDDDLQLFEPTSDDVDVQDFMWAAMNEWYFWQQEVPDLADNRFSGNQAYTEFLQATPDPEDFIQSLLFSEDRFTFWREDIDDLVNSLSGVSKSNGLQFFTVDLTNDTTSNFFLFIRNVIPGSDAFNKGIRRGDVIYQIDGQAITSNNLNALLEPDTYTVSLGELDVANRLVHPTTETVSLTKVENFQEDPIRLATTLDVNGQKIGYLMYQRFNRDFNDLLNDAFGQFLADGVTDLVLDMRYNPGGSVNTSRLLASMIYGTNTNDLYIRQRWNDKQQENRTSEQLEDFFADAVRSGVPLNSLELPRVYVLTTTRTASASELVMNGLDPYVQIIQIGTTTRGKNEFSITLVDDPGNNYVFSTSRQNQINANNRWALQPLTGRNENSVGFLDYTAGFTPDFEVVEDVFLLGTFGNPNEPLLAKALEEITGVASKSGLQAIDLPPKAHTIIGYDTPAQELMVLDKPLQIMQ